MPILYTIQNEYLTVTASEKGAELQSILGSDGTEYLWQGDPTYWSDRALNIFPYVARLTGGCYYLDEKLHRMRIHGIAPYCHFTACVQEQKMAFTLCADEKTMEEYPRNFEFRVIYELKERALLISYEVDNRDQRTMYFGLGGHPGFNVPLRSGLQFEDYHLRFTEPSNPCRINFTKDCFVDGTEGPFSLKDEQTLTLRHTMFDDDAIVLKNMCREIILESERDSHSVTVTFPDMPYLGLWHWPKTDAPYICIEPWLSLPATADKITVFEEQKDLIQLEPGKQYSNCWSILIT